jgi:nicotinamide mononucleotide transporter
MRSLFALVFTLFFQFSFANTYYISPNGNDKTGNGSMINPWQTLYRATYTVTKPGDIIHVMAGTYVETIRCNLAPGVSIEGEGQASIIKSIISEQFVAIIIAVSPEGTDGNQHISNITLDGTNRRTSWGIEVRGRSNFSIHDCIIRDFEESGVYFAGRSDNNTEPPTIYAKGNSFYSNIVTNSAKYDGYGRGALVIGGQEGMLIYNNTISQTGRPKGTNGWPIKYCNNGYLNGCKIYNNKITKQAYEGTTWDFAIELFNESGLEIYGNTIIGSVDMNHQTKGNYAYSVYIHDNIMGPETPQQKMETGMTMEFETEYAIIENNRMRNLGKPFYFTPRDGSLISDVIIRNNVCENIGVADGSHAGNAINFSPDGKGDYVLNNFFIDSNTFLANPRSAPFYGIELTSLGSTSNVRISNNTISGFQVACIVANPAYLVDSLIIENNILSGNGNNNNPLYIRGTPGNYVFSNNTKNNAGSPGFNFMQQVVRPLYHEAKNTSLLEKIAWVAFFLALLFGSLENIYVFPAGVVSAGLFAAHGYESGLMGNVAIYAVFIALAGYGAFVWLQRDRKRHRIVRINSSYSKDSLLQWLIFITAAGAGYFILTSFKQFFAADIIPWGDALASAAAITAVFTMTRKKVSAWYWWMLAAVLLVAVNYMKHYLFNSLCYAALFVMACWGLYQWKRRRMRRRSFQERSSSSV